jgi:hypothetical protein
LRSIFIAPTLAPRENTRSLQFVARSLGGGFDILRFRKGQCMSEADNKRSFRSTLDTVSTIVMLLGCGGYGWLRDLGPNTSAHGRFHWHAAIGTVADIAYFS